MIFLHKQEALRIQKCFELKGTILEKEHLANLGARVAQKRLAYELVSIIHSKADMKIETLLEEYGYETMEKYLMVYFDDEEYEEEEDEEE